MGEKVQICGSKGMIFWMQRGTLLWVQGYTFVGANIHFCGSKGIVLWVRRYTFVVQGMHKYKARPH